MKPDQHDLTASTTFQVAVSEDSARRLEELAGAAGMSPEQFLRASVEEWLSHLRPDFSEAASYVLSKNAELYRRLA
jgi:antitoxin FitA